MTSALVDIAGDDGPLTIEYAWIARARRAQPLLVFLHEGLGSLSRWRDWPQSVCDTIGCRGLVWSRDGYGRSPRRGDEPWTPAYMHQQALQALPRLLIALGIDCRRDPPWLVGHSDGGSIALIYAASFPADCAGVVAIAPHIMVEDISVASIARARDEFREGDLATRLARHHADPVSAFERWCTAWLAPEFRRWSIEDMLPDIRCPVLAMQGDRDEYGTLAQIDGVVRLVPNVERHVIPDCGHWLTRDARAELTQRIDSFIARHITTIPSVPSSDSVH